MNAPTTTSTDASPDGRRYDNNVDDVMEDVNLARRMRDELRPHTRDRKWRFKSYSDCFKAQHALSWALTNIDSNEEASIRRLNVLIERGYLRHVVDPNRRMRIGETRTLYYRMASDDVLDGAMETTTTTTSTRGGGDDGMELPASSHDDHLIAEVDAIRRKAMDLDNDLQRAVERLNRARGKLEAMNQGMLGLISQQICTLVVIFLLYLNTMTYHPSTTTAPSSVGMVGWLAYVALAVAMIVYARCGWGIITLRSYLDDMAIPMDAIVVDNDDVDEDDTTGDESSYAVDPTKGQSRSSITEAISKSLQLATAAGLRSFRRLPSRCDKSVVIMRDERSLPRVDGWRHRPLLICANTTAVPDLIVENDDGPLPLGMPFKFSSGLFEGSCLIRVKGSMSDAPEDDARYFSGRKRIFQSIVQGRFKEEVNVSDVMTGHEFARPLKNLPHPILLKTATNLLSKISPGMSILVHTDQPHIKSSLMETTQIFRGDQPGNEPDIACHRIREDSSIFGGVFARDNIAPSRRKRIFSNPVNCRGYTFDTETVYTFEFYQNAFDGQSYSLDLGFTKIGCSKVFDGQPIQWLGKMRDGRYLWSFQIWHENLLSKDTGKS